MPHQGSVLSRIGQGALAFGANRTSASIDRERSQRDIAGQQVEIGEQNIELNQQQIEAQQAEIQRRQETQGLIGVIQAGGADATTAANRLFQINPEMADQLFESMGATSSAQREDASRRAAAIQATPFDQREAIILEQANNLRSQGRNPSDTESLIGQSEQDQNTALTITQAAAQTTQQRVAGREAGAQRGLQERGVAVTERGIELREDELVAARGLAETARVTKQTEQALKTEGGLRKELNTLLKDFFQVADANARVLAAGTNPSAAGDLALIFNYMKLLDPGSTVREGEFATAQNSASVPQRVRGLYNSITQGQRLSAPQREDFLDRAESLFGAAQGEAQKTADAFERIATNAGVNVGNVLASFQERRRDIDEQPTVTPPSAAIAFLRANDTPENRSQFVQKFGALPEGF